MEISHVIRGDEWIPSTPKHILLYQALGWQPSEFAHLPLILNPDKTKLSKRQGDIAVEDFLNKGYLPEALLNFVAFLGWNPKSAKEIFSLSELISEFSLSNINKSGSVFDINKLDWINSLYIRQIPIENLVEKLKPFWEGTGVNVAKFDATFLKAIANLEKERLKKLSEIGERTAYFFSEPQYEPNLLVWKKSNAEGAKNALLGLKKLFENLENPDFTKENLEIKIKEFISQNNLDNGSVLWPLRTALTGQEKSPGPFEVTETLFLGYGKTKLLERIDTAISKL
jgi:glutamyl/glutaminyl-tRNA synthetase